MPKDTLDEALVDALRAQFTELRDTPVELLSELLGTISVKGWYKEYKERKAVEAALPAQWSAVGLTSEQWAWATTVQRDRSAIRKTHADETKALSEEHTRKVFAANGRRDASLITTQSPLMDLIELGYDNLPLKSQAYIAGSKDKEERDKRTADHVAKMRKAKLNELYPEGSDFKPGLGPAASQGV